jgi:protease I
MDHGVNQNELTGPREALERAGVKVITVSTRKTEVKAWQGEDWGIRIKVDKNLSAVNTRTFDALLIPGGILHADSLREAEAALALITEMYAAGKVIAAVGHGIQPLINTRIIEGRTVASCSSLKTDLILAGALWSDEEVVADNGLVTCKCEDDIELFNKIFLEELQQGVHQRTETII